MRIWRSKQARFLDLKNFHFHKSPKEDKVELTSMQLDGAAIQWYAWYKNFHGTPS